MTELRFYFARFLRRLPWFLAVATLITGIAVTIAVSLPPAYESTLRLLVESKQISDRLAESTVNTSATEQLQIIEQHLLTRENLLRIANDIRPVRDQEEMTPDELVRAMRAQTNIRTQTGRDQATVMTITFEAPTPQAAAGVLNAYLSLILEVDSEFRTERAVTTLEFFEQQVEQLSEKLDEKSVQILEFKNANVEALPETLGFRMDEQSDLQERQTQIESTIAGLRNQRAQLIRVAEATQRIEETQGTAVSQMSPRQLRLAQLEQELEEALSIYSEQSPQVRQLKARIAQLQSALEPEAEETAAADAEDTGEDAFALGDNPMLDVQLAEIDGQVEVLEAQKIELESQIEVLRDTISRTPANAIALEALERDYNNLQLQYNQAADRVSRASTGERIELLSRGQRITVVEPPAVPTEPTKPNRRKLAVLGVAAGMGSGLGLVFLMEFLNRTARRPEDIVARFEVLPIATIPYVRSRRQMVLDRGIKMLVILTILIGVPAAIYAVHQYYMPIDLVAEKVMNRLGVRW